ncbi:DUF397 domain-containing protein [Streptomyces scabiei]|nr:DUF397 domain-containing protein [Streptomyces sp. LBUM 1477]QTU50903.1 DUF397 domain-containing protein [Streptomyces sp. LBUM 1482]
MRTLAASDLDVTWVKSSYSNGGNNCVEVAGLEDAVAVRDSKNPDGPALVLPGAVFGSFVTGVRTGSLHA